jgi:hypothetical protein
MELSPPPARTTQRQGFDVSSRRLLFSYRGTEPSPSWLVRFADSLSTKRAARPQTALRATAP